jgi:hypothetical protein
MLVFRGDMKLYDVLSIKLHKNETVSYILHPLSLNECKKNLKSAVHIIFCFHILVNWFFFYGTK